MPVALDEALEAVRLGGSLDQYRRDRQLDGGPSDAERAELVLRACASGIWSTCPPQRWTDGRQRRMVETSPPPLTDAELDEAIIPPPPPAVRRLPVCPQPEIAAFVDHRPVQPPPGYRLRRRTSASIASRWPAMTAEAAEGS